MRAAIFILALPACTASWVDAKPAGGDEVTFFVPGYEGSFLVTDQGERAWLTLGELASRGDRSLALPFPGQHAGASFGPLHADGPMTSFTVLPWVLYEDIYLSWLRFGRAHLPGFRTFAYDWRHDIRETGDALCAAIERAAMERPNLVVNIVAHSMGGLVALHCATSASVAARRIRRVAFVGTPFRGSPTALGDLLFGRREGRNTALLSKEALFSFPSFFELLPADDDFLVDAAGQPMSIDLLQPETWTARRWGVFSEGAVDRAYVAQLRRVLEGLRAREAEVRDETPVGFRSLAVLGTGRPTKASFRVIKDEVQIDGPLLADGDGTVLRTSAMPPPSLSAEQMTSSAGHVQLLGDPPVQRAIAAFIASH